MITPRAPLSVKPKSTPPVPPGKAARRPVPAPILRLPAAAPAAHAKSVPTGHGTVTAHPIPAPIVRPVAAPTLGTMALQPHYGSLGTIASAVSQVATIDSLPLAQTANGGEAHPPSLPVEPTPIPVATRPDFPTLPINVGADSSVPSGVLGLRVPPTAFPNVPSVNTSPSFSTTYDSYSATIPPPAVQAYAPDMPADGIQNPTTSVHTKSHTFLLAAAAIIVLFLAAR